MNFYFRRTYRGPLSAVIFDWAGTTVDHGSRAPVAAFQATFEADGVPITVTQARGPMGMAKKDHIREILKLAEVTAAWRAVKGRDWTETDVETLYARFIPLQNEVLPNHSELIPGVASTIGSLRERGLKLGGTTGYDRTMMDVVEPLAAAQGYAVDPGGSVTISEVPAGRPAPWMVFEAMKRLRAWPVEAVVKVGDTRADIEEGLNAGCWTVGVALTGNETGLSAAELDALDPTQRQTLHAQATDNLARAGAHYVIESVATLEPILDAIATRLRAGERP
ncbi:phosphonoacetaldehyde hydrolase [Isosphaera pallida ATCC 43644]|uniref:phosphonoacetaldehyde hydrolase n=1 Tax=Isosphaera pallida (strain ATCC 43644 / DSM 9630 / IS1B) TaxID=575540 RepID=E8R316_ISOPI|nr:phosphonoacetaldehyde hydrolase [Isosphaera pallida]ADV61520.1 phosphonoacetaldehyde hydrolase [Isosphaera pallida ATCC 43644]